MKDFHDLYRLMQAEIISGNVEQIIRSVFKHRGTKIRLPITFEKQDGNSLQVLWDRHIQGLSDKAGMPSDFGNLVTFRFGLCMPCLQQSYSRSRAIFSLPIALGYGLRRKAPCLKNNLTE